MRARGNEGAADGSSSQSSKSRAPYRLKRWTHIERDLRKERGPLLAGVDEVGRGPIAGPVVACAVIMPPDMRAIRGVDDSKALTAQERQRLVGRIQERALAWALGAASVREIERFNIYQASVLAMKRALARLPMHPDHVIIDGKAMRTLPVPHTAIVHGDARCFSIACASIIAKVTRDRLMTRLALRYPAYTWERNVGYTTRAHIRGLDSNGITPHHRRSFFRVSQLLLDFGEAQSVDEMQSAEHRDDLILLTDIDATIIEEIAQA
ncbi:MAG TPA: ribonuclease HII [Gemmatimonadaceae bacterium]|nr:ribonuclease HII [Gemmatimonadaceae bacterium]